jgi:hypothetical protein
LNFAGRRPLPASGKGPYRDLRHGRAKDVTMTLVNPDTTIVVNKLAYAVQVSTCIRTPL